MKRLLAQLRGRGQLGTESNATSEPDVTADATPILISRRTRTALILTMLFVLGVVVWRVPSVLTTAVGGFALALAELGSVLPSPR